jgi:hypothetical protein
LNLPPSPSCSDEEFIRRAFLDTTGTLPTPDEVREFLAEATNERRNRVSESKSDGQASRISSSTHSHAPSFPDSGSSTARDRLIDSLLERPEFVDYWSYKWSDLLLVGSERLRPAAMWSYYNWVRQSVAANVPWDQSVRQLVTARGSTLENGAANFYALHDDPPNMAETVTQAFLGMSINCAKCHNHPMEKWTNDEYFGFANLFARVRMKSGPGDGEKVVFVANTGDINQPLRGRPQKPKPLDAASLDIRNPPTAVRRSRSGSRLATILTLRVPLPIEFGPIFSASALSRKWTTSGLPTPRATKSCSAPPLIFWRIGSLT